MSRVDSTPGRVGQVWRMEFSSSVVFGLVVGWDDGGAWYDGGAWRVVDLETGNQLHVGERSTRQWEDEPWMERLA